MEWQANKYSNAQYSSKNFKSTSDRLNWQNLKHFRENSRPVPLKLVDFIYV